MVGGGDPIEGIQAIGRGEDLLSELAAAGTQKGVAFLSSQFPDETRAVIDAMVAAGEGANVVVSYIDDSTGKTVSTTWNKIPKNVQDTIKGGVAVATFVFPAGVAAKIAKAAPSKGPEIDVDRPETGGGEAPNKGTRFISRADGQTLDTESIVVAGPTNSPYGKMDYLLGKVPGNQDSIGKGGYFGDTLGFQSGDDLAIAMQKHLKDNFGNAVIKVNKVEVTAPITGPNGVTANVKAAWQVKPDGSVSFVTAFPGPKL